MQNLDNIMDELIKSYSEDQIRNAYGNAVKRQVDNKRKKEIDAARVNVLQSVRKYLITTYGAADESLIKEFENELLKLERREAVDKAPKRTEKTDDEKLKEFIDNLFAF